MKKFLVLGAILFVAVGCSNTEDMNLRTAENLEMEDVNSEKKPLEDIIVFNQDGVTIRKEGNNLILSMEQRVLFDFDKSVIRDKVKSALNTLATALVANPDIRIKIDGFTDSKGSDLYNLELSHKRATAIKTYLVGRDVVANNVTVEGMGELNPLGDNTTEEGRQDNRRVEFIVSRAF
ncbi:MAG: OmpA family protein [Fusobacteriaceae bacterium]